jgi:hypothetical protein
LLNLLRRKSYINEKRINDKLTKLLGLQWQGVHSKDVSGEYRVRFPGEITLGQCACLYARTGLVAHLWLVGTGAKAKKNGRNENGKR